MSWQKNGVSVCLLLDEIAESYKKNIISTANVPRQRVW